MTTAKSTGRPKCGWADPMRRNNCTDKSISTTCRRRSRDIPNSQRVISTFHLEIVLSGCASYCTCSPTQVQNMYVDTDVFVSFGTRDDKKRPTTGQGIALSIRRLPDDFQALVSSITEIVKPPCKTCEAIFDSGTVKQATFLAMSNQERAKDVLSEIVNAMKEVVQCMARESNDSNEPEPQLDLERPPPEAKLWRVPDWCGLSCASSCLLIFFSDSWGFLRAYRRLYHTALPKVPSDYGSCLLEVLHLLLFIPVSSRS